MSGHEEILDALRGAYPDASVVFARGAIVVDGEVVPAVWTRDGEMVTGEAAFYVGGV